MRRSTAFTALAWLSLASALAVGLYAYLSDGHRMTDVVAGWGILTGGPTFSIYRDNSILVTLPMSLIVGLLSLLPLCWAVVTWRRQQAASRQRGFAIVPADGRDSSE